MFDFAWSEIALIAAVALLAIGPKDMPVAIRSMTTMIKKARRMASEFQTHVDEMVREANLEDVRSQINEIRNFDVRGEVERNIDPDGSLRSTFDSNPLIPHDDATAAGEGAGEPVTPGEHAVAEGERPPDLEAAGTSGAGTSGAATSGAANAPAFIPPGAVPPPQEPCAHPAARGEPEPPAFIPPGAALRRRPPPAA